MNIRINPSIKFKSEIQPLKQKQSFLSQASSPKTASLPTTSNILLNKAGSFVSHVHFCGKDLELPISKEFIEPSLYSYLQRTQQQNDQPIDLRAFIKNLFEDAKIQTEAEQIFEKGLMIPPPSVQKLLLAQPELGKGTPPEDKQKALDSKMEQLLQTTFGVRQSEQGDVTAPPRAIGLGDLLNTLLFYTGEGKIEDPIVDELKKLSSVRMKNGQPEKSILDKLSRDLVFLARMGKLAPVIGRESETLQVMTALSKSQKRTPLLIGEPGVGKTAILENLAHKLASGDVPSDLLSKEGRGKALKLVDLSAFDAMQPNDAKEAFKALLDEAIERSDEVILGMDEFQRISPKNGTTSFANMLKPPLARGEVSMIGTTTEKEYKEQIETDGALARRVDTIQVDEPTDEQTLDILRGLVEYYENKHKGIKITDTALEAAVHKGRRFLSGQNMPDVAIDLIDKASAMIKNQVGNTTYAKRLTQSEIKTLEIRQKGLERRVAELKDESSFQKEKLEKLGQALKDKLISEGNQVNSVVPELELLLNRYSNTQICSLKDNDFEKMLLIRHKEDFTEIMKHARKVSLQNNAIAEAQKQLEETQVKLAKLQSSGSQNGEVLGIVRPEDIYYAVSQKSGLPISQISTDEQELRREKLKNMSSAIRQRLIGQGVAVDAIVSAVTKNEMGMNQGNRPIGSFMFLGPTGVGKTELAKVLAEYLFDDEKNMVRLDMSEYMEGHSVARLIGSPPGYVGYEEGGQLTEAVRKRPYSVILMDEVEKAHPEVLNIFLQILEDGRLTDGKGRTVDFRNTILIFTSNVGSQQIMSELTKLGEDTDLESEAYLNKYGEIKEALDVQLKRRFKPEYLNRFDDLILFHPLFKQHIREIVDIQVRQLNKQLKDNPSKIQVKIDDSAREYLADLGTDPEYGARPLKREIEKVKTAISFAMLEGEIHAGETVEISADRLQHWEKKAEERKRNLGSRRASNVG